MSSAAPHPGDDVDAASAEIDRAEASVTALLGSSGGAVAMANGAHTEGLPPPSAPAQPPRPSTEPKGEKPVPAPSADSAMESDKQTQCKNACDALTSMMRAVTHLCDITGNDDARCSSARGRAERAEERVTQSCSDCSP